MSPVAVTLPDHMISFSWTNHASNPCLQYVRENVILFRAIGGKDSKFSNISKFLTTNIFLKKNHGNESRIDIQNQEVVSQETLMHLT